MKTKLFIFVSLAVTILSAVILRFYEPKPTKEIKTPMGHEMEYIRHMDEFLYEYRDHNQIAGFSYFQSKN